MASRACLFPPIMPKHLPLITVNNGCLLVCCSKYYKWYGVWLLERQEKQLLSPPTTSEHTVERHAEQCDIFIAKFKPKYNRVV